MKFSAYLRAVDADAPPEWKFKFLKYRLLKKLVKGLRYRAALARLVSMSDEHAFCR